MTIDKIRVLYLTIFFTHANLATSVTIRFPLLYLALSSFNIFTRVENAK